MDERERIKQEAIDTARCALKLLDALGERRPAALIQQAIDELGLGFNLQAFDVVEQRMSECATQPETDTNPNMNAR